jgi:hypothetical protein
MLDVKVFIGELASVNRLSTGPVARSEVPRLEYKIFDDPVEGAILRLWVG